MIGVKYVLRVAVLATVGVVVNHLPLKFVYRFFHSARRCEWAEYSARDRLGCYIFVDKTSAVERGVSHIWLAAMSIPVTEVSVLEHRVGMLLTRRDLAQSHVREAKVCPVCVYDV